MILENTVAVPLGGATLLSAVITGDGTRLILWAGDGADFWWDQERHLRKSISAVAEPESPREKMKAFKHHDGNVCARSTSL
mmetsp:Transcript_101317/g.194186  ORF Transcript_101317/g.194186 Transcript_101317/m.194186 type:complete len:81 (+) Transcript_101317:1300-1542(+)